MSVVAGRVPVADVDEGLRTQLRELADAMIPEAHGMPAASAVGVADRGLDRIVAARPDLAEPLARVAGRVRVAELESGLAELAEHDPEAHEALLLVIVGAYYTHPDVRAKLGYTGQQPVEVRPELIPDYVDEGLIEPLFERGPAYRRVPGAE